MRRYFSKSLTLFLLLSFACDAAAPPLSFEQFYLKAAQAHEQVAAQKSRITQAEAEFDRARGAVFPSISFLTTYTRQESPAPTAGSLSAFRLPEQWNSRFNLTQPLFRGFGEFSELSARSWEVDGQKASLFDVERRLYDGISQAYFELQASRQDMVNLLALRKLTQDRLSDLQHRAKIGRSRTGEVLTAEAQLVALDSQIEANKLAISQAENRLSLQSGVSAPFEIETQDLSEKKLPKQVPGLKIYTERVETRPDIVALQAQEKAADRRVTVARAGHYPTLDFSANYYLKRTGAQDGVHWDIGFTLALPIFQGGSVLAGVESAIEMQKQATLLLAQTLRTARLDLSNAYDLLESSYKQIDAWTKSVEISERNYKEQKRDYGLGLATNMEVLQALNSYQELQRTLDRARAQRLSAWASLRAIVGDLPSL